MKHFLPLSIALLGSVLLGNAQDVKEPKLLFIGVDGVRSDALAEANTPTFDSLFNTSLFTKTSWHLGVTSSGPSWSNMCTGVWEAKHGVTSNSYAGSNYSEYPYFPNRIKSVRPDVKAIQIITWNPMNEVNTGDGTVIGTGGNVTNSRWDRSIDAGNLGQRAATEAALVQITDPSLDILFIHYDEVDAAGHSFTFAPTTERYIQAIEGVDSEMNEIFNAIRNRPSYEEEDWLIVMTTDHGGNGFSHGGNTDQERLIWWLASGSEESINRQELIAGDPGSYQISGDNPTLENIRRAPVQTDIAATAIGHMLKYTDVNVNEMIEWDLDGFSWVEHVGPIDPGSGPVLGINNDKNELLIYPNPTSDSFKIEMPSNVGNFEYKVISSSGVVVDLASIRGNVIEIKTSGYEQGIYFVQVTSESFETVQKLVVK